MSTAVHSEMINGQKFNLVWEENDQPAVEYKGHAYNSLAELIAAAPFLAESKYLQHYVRVANFLFTGLDFLVIENAEEYKQRYLRNAGKLTKEYGIYDPSSIKEPYVENGKLIFFAENNSSAVPYKVISTYPYQKGGSCDYKLLPQKT